MMRRPRFLTPILALLALLFAACASGAAATNSTTSGIVGQVLIGPMCPVMQEGVPCPDQPFQATITVLGEQRKQVAQFESDAQGNFKAGLRPGTYVLVPESPDGFTHAAEQTVTVVEGQFLRITINYDSGIR